MSSSLGGAELCAEYS